MKRRLKAFDIERLENTSMASVLWAATHVPDPGTVAYPHAAVCPTVMTIDPTTPCVDQLSCMQPSMCAQQTMCMPTDSLGTTNLERP